MDCLAIILYKNNYCVNVNPYLTLPFLASFIEIILQ